MAAGAWAEKEIVLHINVLEMMSGLITLTAFQECLMGHTTALISDTVTVMACSYKQGGTVFNSPSLLT